ncbi:MAG: NYN domain-containing protein, partial [Streptosporangiaceae bacterium]
MDRCALFVDAGYVLTDGAMAAQGTSQREAITWDYPGLLQFLAGLAVDRTGLPLLRCYWYEATVDGRRTAEHDTLADLPGLTLRLGRMRPGKREGVETEIHRDLTTLARNRAVSDVLLVSAEDDLAQVIADVQDLGVRVIIVHISVDGNWTVSRALRQQCDDIVEIQGTQLRPYAELTGGEPARYGEQYAASVYGGRSMSNGHAANSAGGGYSSLPAGSAGAHPAPPAIYTAPVVAEYQQPPAAPPVPPSPFTA